MKPKHVYSNMPDPMEEAFVKGIIGPTIIQLINDPTPPQSIADLTSLFYDCTEWKVSPRTVRRWLDLLGMQLKFHPHWTHPGAEQQEALAHAHAPVAAPAEPAIFDNESNAAAAQPQGTDDTASLEALKRELAQVKAMLAMPRPPTPARSPQRGSQSIDLDQNPFAPKR